MYKARLLALAALMLAAISPASAQIRVLESSSSPLVHLCFGGWNYFPNTEYRYAEGFMETTYTTALAQPTHLNVLHCYSQSGGSCVVKVYLATSPQAPVSLADPHHHGIWWNSPSATPGYYVGQFTSVNSPVTLTSFDVDSFVSANPAALYYVMFDQQDDVADEGILMTWLGPQGRFQDVAEATPTLPGRPEGASCSPNPSAGISQIRYSVSRAGKTEVRIIGAAGRTVRTLFSGVKPAGSDCILWDGCADSGIRAAPGTYFFEITSADSRSTAKIVLR